MCVEVIVCYISIVFLRHSVYTADVSPSAKLQYLPSLLLSKIWL